MAEEINFNQDINDISEFDMSQIPAEERERIDEINELIKAEKLDATTAMNILINAVQVSYDKDHFNELDRYLIAKSLMCFKEYVEKGEDFTIKVN